ncbi:MAG: DNA mismatch repair protein MutS [SAR202 cluster bacterium]|nr:DNA mismatch repair protein MutS [SAR202 cluster bacterium]
MDTPARKQYLRIKSEHPEEILLFRMGDFYETFDDDARVISKQLDIALTTREMGKGKRIPLAGIPYHALEGYLAKLIKAGNRVAICEQVSEPSASRGLIEREVVRVVTPGTVIEDSLIERGANNYLAAVITSSEIAGLSYVDITTGEFMATEFSIDNLKEEIERINPSEIIIDEGLEDASNWYSSITRLSQFGLDINSATNILLKHFEVKSLIPYGCADMPLAIKASASIINYLSGVQKSALSQIKSLTTYSIDDFMIIDSTTRKNLELFSGGRQEDSEASLRWVLDLAETAMGSRLIKQWIGRPSLNIQELCERQNLVEWFYDNSIIRAKTRGIFNNIPDLERIVNKVRGGNAGPRDLMGLALGLEMIADFKGMISTLNLPEVVIDATKNVNHENDLISYIRNAIIDEPAILPGEGKVVKEGYSSDLDQLRNSSKFAHKNIKEMENKEKEASGIKSLKVGYNRVFGYYIEVSNSYTKLVPDHYIRRQTLVAGERYITTELKEYESIVLNAKESLQKLEVDLFKDICSHVDKYSDSIMETARAIAKLDALGSFAEVASVNGYIKPELKDDYAIEISDSRHPIVERKLFGGEFVPNDIFLSNEDQQLVVLTGPNMSGKSTYLRQVALIVLMAQIGSYVPAGKASVGIVDRIFTRVGLTDDSVLGQSTFMVEMIETALILNQATPQSLLILDEIGRGTSTYDGLAIAIAVVEHIHNSKLLGCKTLFATHYHELIEIADKLPRANNYNVSIYEENGEVVYLRKILTGGASKSYGIQVAELAGLPENVISRSKEILNLLEKETNSFDSNDVYDKSISCVEISSDHKAVQLPFPVSIDVLKNILNLDINSMTPLEAMNKLNQIQKELKQLDGLV